MVVFMSQDNKNKQNQNEKNLGITAKKEDDFSEWYTQLLKECELADIRYNIKGLIIYMPWSTKTIKKMYHILEQNLDKKNHEPLTMPTLIPESNFTLESDHVEGFTPEVFWVTHGGVNKLEEKLALRPTSETAFYQMFALWIRSHKDLPFKRYQSGQVFRYEGKATRPFFRGREFHWIETHCAHATHEDAVKQVKQDMEITQEFLFDECCLPFIFFDRPEWDKFAGAVKTFAADVLMGSGKVLQLPSTHLLGTNFSKPFNVKYTDKHGEEKLVHLTCYGPAISRIYGAMISYHGDNKGLVLPFNLAPVQIIIIPILFEKTKEIVLKEAEKLKEHLGKYYEVHLDADETLTPGFKYNFWEMKGVPIRIALGPKDLEKSQVEIFRRDTNKKEFVQLNKLDETLKEIKKTFTKNLRDQSSEKFDSEIINVKTKEELYKAISDGKMVRAPFCSVTKEGKNCADELAKDTAADVRGTKAFADEKPEPHTKCVMCKNLAHEIVYIAKSY